MASHMSVVHAWAHQSGRNNQAKGHHMFYEGDTIYSYGHHFPIARLIDTNEGKAVLFTTRGHSVSTAKHKSYTLRGIPSDYPVIKVDNPCATALTDDYAQSMLNARDCIAKSKRARTHGDIHLTAAQRWIDNANILNRVFAMGHDEVTMETLGVNVADIEARIAEGQRRAREVERNLRIRRNAEQAEQRQRWLAGEHVPYHGTDDHGRALLRVRGSILETSQGACVPLREAIEVFKLMARCKREGKAWPYDYVTKGRVNDQGEIEGGETFTRPRVGDYRVDDISIDGMLVAGCHTIGFDEAQRLAALLKIEVEV